MLIQPIVREAITNVTYGQAKTRADKFVERIGSIPASIEKPTFNKPVNENISALSENDSFKHNDNNLEIEHNGNDKFVENNSEDFNPKSLNFPTSSKTTAHKFVQQLSSVTQNQDVNKPAEAFGFVDIGEPATKTSTLKTPELRKVNFKQIEQLTAKNNLSESINNLPIKHSLKQQLLKKAETYKAPDDISKDEEVSDLVNKFINDTVNEAIANAELAESLLDLTVVPGLNIEINFLVKLREIITDLDKALREVQKQVDSKKKDSHVEIKIKRFDIRDLKAKTKI